MAYKASIFDILGICFNNCDKNWLTFYGMSDWKIHIKTLKSRGEATISCRSILRIQLDVWYFCPLPWLKTNFLEGSSIENCNPLFKRFSSIPGNQREDVFQLFCKIYKFSDSRFCALAKKPFTRLGVVSKKKSVLRLQCSFWQRLLIFS